MNESEILSPTEVDNTGWRPRVLGVRRIGGRAGFIVVTVLGALAALILYGIATAGHHLANPRIPPALHATQASPSWLDALPTVRRAPLRPAPIYHAAIVPQAPAIAPPPIVPDLRPITTVPVSVAQVGVRVREGENIAAQAPILVGSAQGDAQVVPLSRADLAQSARANQTQPPDERASFGAAAAAAMPEPIVVGERVPASELTIMAGSVIPALLVSGINADLPGFVLARVRSDVYDTQRGQTLLIPAGTTLLGRYDSHVTQGERRVMVAWTRMTFADGTSVGLGGMGATDEAGYAGLSAHVDEHLNKAFNGALLLSIISAGAQLSQPQRSAVGFAAPDAGQTVAGAVGNQISSVSIELAQRQLGVLPTLEVAPGYQFDVLVDRDIAFTRTFDDEKEAP